MNSKNRRALRLAAATLPEVLIAAAVASIILGGLMVGSIVLQRSLNASDRLSRAQADLLRVTDYISRDVRNATSVNATPSGTVLLTITTGDYYNRKNTPSNPKDDVPYDPVLGRTGVTYGTSPITIRYLRSGTGIVREVTCVDGGVASTTTARIGDNVDNLSVVTDAVGTATATSSTATYYARRKAGVPAPTISLVTVAKPRNPNL